MPKLSRPESNVRAAVFAALAVVLIGGAAAADSSLGEPLCAVVKKLLPEIKSYKPEGARAQLVMAVGQKFDYDGVKLRKVQSEIDRATSASCPKERQDMLGILKMKSLAEAVI